MGGNSNDLMRLLGAPVVTCAECGDTCFGMASFYVVNMIDGEMAGDEDDSYCSQECAEKANKGRENILILDMSLGKPSDDPQ